MPRYEWTNPRDVYIRVALNLSGGSGSRAGNAGSHATSDTAYNYVCNRHSVAKKVALSLSK